MKPSVAVLVLLLGLGLVACSGEDDGGDGDRPDSSDRAESTPSVVPEPEPQPEPDPAALADTEACGLVRDGIDAFNLDDLEGTIEAFEEAIGPAEDLARDQPGVDTELLLEAVRYYAALPAEDYVEANVSSPEFARFKDFTLTACAYTGPPVETTEPGIPA